MRVARPTPCSGLSLWKARVTRDMLGHADRNLQPALRSRVRALRTDVDRSPNLRRLRPALFHASRRQVSLGVLIEPSRRRPRGTPPSGTCYTAEPSGSADLGSGAHQLSALRQIADLVNATADLDAIFERVVMAICQHTRWSSAGIMAVNRTSGFSELVTRYGSQGGSASNDLPRRWPLDRSPTRVVVQTRQPVVIRDAQVATEYPDYQTDALARGYHTVAILPLNVADPSGSELVLSAQSNDLVEVGEEELNYLTTIAHLSSIAVGKARSIQVERSSNDRLKRILDSNATLFERVLAGATLEAVAALVASALRNPFVVLDLATELAQAYRSPDPSRLSDRHWSEAANGPWFEALRQLVVTAPPAGLRERVTFRFAFEGTTLSGPAHVERLVVDGELVGGLVVFPGEGSLDDLDVLVGQGAVFALSAQLMRGHVLLKSETAELSAFWGALVESGEQDLDVLRVRAARLGIEIDAVAQLFLVAAPTKERSAEDRAALLALERSVRMRFPAASAVRMAAGYLLRVPCEPAGVSCHARQQILRVAAKAIGLSVAEQAKVAESAPVTKAEDLVRAYETCRRVLRLAEIFGKRGLLREHDFGPMALLVSALDDKAVPAFVAETVGRIKAHDDRHRGSLLGTAAAFIDAGCRYQATADRLGIHVSTLRYRLARLRELFGFDLQQPETRFTLSFALRLQTLDGNPDELQRFRSQ